MKTIDYVTLLLCFTAIGYIGYRSTKQVHDSEDFILAGRNIGKFRTALSLAASDVGGSSMVGAAAMVYTIGISGALWNLSFVPVFFMLGYVISKMSVTLEVSTLPEYMGNRYNSRVRAYTTLLHIFSLTAGLSVQFVVSSTVISSVLGISQNLAMLISLVVIILYTTGGGLVAVVNTDVFQFFILIGSIMLVVPMAIMKVGGIRELTAALPASYLSFGELGFWTPFSWLILGIFFYGTNQAYLQRVFAARNKETAAFGFYFTGFFYILFGLLVGILGLVIFVLFKDLPDPNTGFTVLIVEVMPPGMVGIAIGGLFAATMSTADSILLAASTIFTNDIYGLYIKKESTDQDRLKMVRIITVVLAVSGGLLSGVFTNIIDIVYFSGLLYSASVFLPFAFGIRFHWITPKAAEYSILSALAVGLLSQYYLSVNFTGILGLPPNIISSSIGALVLFGVSYLERYRDSIKRD